VKSLLPYVETINWSRQAIGQGLKGLKTIHELNDLKRNGEVRLLLTHPYLQFTLFFE